MRVLLVSKAIRPPWNDSTKNLVRDLAPVLVAHDVGLHVTVLGSSETSVQQWAHANSVACAPVYGNGASGFQVPLSDAVTTVAYLAATRADVTHYFFAPNPRTSKVARLLMRAKRMRTVQTIASTPHEDHNIADMMFADVNIVLSEATRQRLLKAGIAHARVVKIPPCVAPLAAMLPDAALAAKQALAISAAQLFVFVGDFEFGAGAATSIAAFAKVNGALPDAMLLLCGRDKTPHAKEVRRRLERDVQARGLSTQVRFLGTVPNMHEVLRAADVVLLPEPRLYAKMDLPLVLIEAMYLGKPIIVCEGSSAAELLPVDGSGGVAARNDADAVAAQLLQYASNPTHAYTHGARLRAHALENYTPERVAAQHVEVYREVFKRR